MARYVFWMGWIYVAFALLFFSPEATRASNIHPSEGIFWTDATGLLIVFLGMAMVFGSRNLAARGTLVFWIGCVLLVLSALELNAGLYQGEGRGLVYAGVFDVTVGVSYLVGLPRSLHCSPLALLLDRV